MINNTLKLDNLFCQRYYVINSAQTKVVHVFGWGNPKTDSFDKWWFLNDRQERSFVSLYYRHTKFYVMLISPAV